ncbi:autotransporter domain-containing protein [Aquabacter cavernae]|uniref:autotransporter domain-containing protein n=1 Tax=Aquabacter cavernae TaxID=2496029 RepID=UPI000F8E3E47|nr:autotransporter domain-containing protein [Aquabacter cavernae]
MLTLKSNVLVLSETHAPMGLRPALSRATALGLLAAGTFLASASPAAAQLCTTTACEQSVATLSAFGTLLNTPEGMALLQATLAKEIEIYRTSTLDQQNLATINAQGPFVPWYVSGNIWAMVPGTTAQTLSSTAYSQALPPLVTQELNNVLSTTYVGEAKAYYAQNDTYGIAYGVTNNTPDPRPYLVTTEVSGHPWTTVAPGPFPGLTPSDICYQACQWTANAPEPSFPSGHTEAGYTTGLLYAVLLPEYYQGLVTAAQTFGYSRNILGVHYPLDVVGGRIIATYNLVQWLAGAYQPNFQQEMKDAAEELRIMLGGSATVPYASCASDVASCMAAGVFPTAAEFTAANLAMVSFLTYDLPSVGSTTDAPIVPENAYLLLQTRFPYLTPDQINAVIASTELASGVPLDDHATGWARLNLYAAAGGYGAFTSDVTVTLTGTHGYQAIDMWSNNISGPGGLTKLGDGVLVLGGDNTFTGGTNVGAGTLALTGSMVGDLTVSAGATFLTAGGYKVARDATLTNDGTVQSVNAVLRSHGTIDNRGLMVSDIINDGTLTNSGTIQGVSAGLTSNGTLKNTGTIVSDVANGGTLANTGTIIGTLTNTGTLKGTGALVGDLMNQGVLAPGNSIGTTSVTGAVTFGAGSTYQVEVAANGASDLLVAGGPITLGGTLQFVQTDAAVQPFTSYTILTSGTGITGSFATVIDPFGTAFPFLDVALTTSGTGLSAAVMPDSAAFASFQGSANQRAVGSALASLPGTNGLLQSASMLSAAAAPAALDLLSGQIYASAATVLQEQSGYVREAIGARLRQTGAGIGTGGPATAALAPGLAPTVWLQAYGGWGSTDATANTAEVTRSIGGVVGGLDVALGENWRVGLAGGYSQSSYSLEGLASSGGADSYDLAAYAGGQWDAFAVRLGAAYGWHDLSTNRTVVLPGFVDALSSDNSGNTAQVFGELAYGFALGAARIEPFAALSYVHLNLGGFTEAGGAVALTGASLTQDNTFSALGARVSQSVALGAGTLTARGSLAWQYAFGDMNPVQTLAFSGSTPFSVSGAPIGRNAALIGVGLDYRVSTTVSVGVAYSGAFSDVGQDNAVNGRLSIAF